MSFDPEPSDFDALLDNDIPTQRNGAPSSSNYPRQLPSHSQPSSYKNVQVPDDYSTLEFSKVPQSKLSEEEIEKNVADNLAILNSFIKNISPESPPLQSALVIDNNVKTLKHVNEAHVYSSELSETYEQFYCPLYCNRIAHSRLHYDATISTDKPTVVKLPSIFLQSFTDYAQGDAPIVTDTPRGNLKNTFLLSVRMKRVVSTADFPIAVRIGSCEKKFDDFTGKAVKVLRPEKTKHHLTHMHEVIPPKSSGVELTLYTSDYEINNTFAMEYPWLTADKDVIRKGILTIGKSEYVPFHSPVAKWVYQNGAKYDWVLPDKTEKLAHMDDYFIVMQKIWVDVAVSHIAETMKRLEIRDLTHFALELIPLTDMIKTTDKAKEVYVSLSLYVKHVFRDRYIPGKPL